MQPHQIHTYSFHLSVVLLLPIGVDEPLLYAYYLFHGPKKRKMYIYTEKNSGTKHYGSL